MYRTYSTRAPPPTRSIEFDLKSEQSSGGEQPVFLMGVTYEGKSVITATRSVSAAVLLRPNVSAELSVVYAANRATTKAAATMTYTLYGGEILPRDPPRPPRCEALMHFSATQPSPRQPKSPRTPRSLPAMDPATIQSPRRLGAPVSGRPWSPGLVDAQGQWNPVVAEEVSPARLRAVPTSRAEAAALHDELLERLSAEPRLSYADQMRLVDFGMAEAARQARPLVD